MSYEVFGDDDDDGGYSFERVNEIGSACFVKGAQVCREMMARFVEQGGNPNIANSIRANWNPSWGADPGQIGDADYDQIRSGFDPMSVD